METVHRANTGQFYCYRTVVYFDKQTKLPVRFEAYDWPAAGGTPGGEKLECYSYVDVKFNVGLTDAAFGL
jgi:outer membrane lipoprotein-sorting protein